MRPIDYEALADKLIEEYPLKENSELYSLYTSMLQHLMKCFKLKHSTAVKLLLKVEEHLSIHFIRDKELTNMKMLNLKKNDDVNRYYRMMYWIQKINLETISEIYNKYNDISSAIVKRYMHESGKLSDNQIVEYNYSHNYYREHRDELLKKKREYRARKKKERENKQPTKEVIKND